MIKYLQFFAFTIISIFINPLFSQAQVPNGPGGVGSTNGASDLVLWLDADRGNNTNTKWTDQSGRGFDFREGNGAAFQANSVNGYSTYNFDGETNYFQKPFEQELNPDEFSVFTASKVKINDDYQAVISSRNEYYEFPNFNKKGFVLYSSINSNHWLYWTGSGSDWRVYNVVWHHTNSNISTLNQWSIQNINYKHSGRNNTSLFVDSDYSVKTSHPMVAVTSDKPAPFRIGAGANEGAARYHFKGDIGEVIMYKSAINEAQRIIIDNYLSAKYNIPLAENNYYTHDDGNKVFDHHVAGIGKTTGSNVHNDSKGTGIVRMKSP
ncbi:MAG TPA: hypothetical protein VKY41_08515, partial [Xanthomarina sp.]|nr:hypothetical protein [Xanthomarina sp.]